MKKILIFILSGLFCMANAGAAVRGENTAVRAKSTPSRTAAQTTRSTVSRNAVKTTVSARSAKPVSVLSKQTPNKTNTTKKNATRTATVSRSAKKQNVVARAAQSDNHTETKIGEVYETCKTAFFTCMDQFCPLKNDNFRRCSCSDKVYNYQDISNNYQKVSERLTEFSEDLDVVGMTKEQATAMKTASEGENALTEDKSASKQLLQAIMNAINGGDAKVGGKYEQLNSVIAAEDISNSFGMDDSGQIIASYNGTTLYKAVYPKCRNAVAEDCNSASLQRAVNAYLMAIEQDCNTVEAALKKQQKTLKGATHQSSAMLDLARVENRQNHNSDDISTCMLNVEQAIQSEEVCGAKYHKCLDYGQFIDVTTGAPLTGVADFYKLGQLLTFKNTENIKDQKLSTLSNNRNFINFFENKAKKFAADALDKCNEQSKEVWQQYLDRALLDIYYAQQDKVKEIQDSCFSLVAACYENQKTSIAAAMANLTGDSNILIQPASIALTTEMCSDYIDSCNNMFNGNIIEQYLANKDSVDSEKACRAVVQQCFDKFGGTGYENFYNPSSGLFASGEALDWFTLYDKDNKLLSPCAQALENTEGCKGEKDTDGKNAFLEQVFGGFNKDAKGKYYYYNIVDEGIDERTIRPNGVATEIYYKIIDNLSTQCSNIKGYFVEYKYLEQYDYNVTEASFCTVNTVSPTSIFAGANHQDNTKLDYWYHFFNNENMCPADYEIQVDVNSWGICSCWENGGYRSKNGTSKTCVPVLPIQTNSNSDSGSDVDCAAENLDPKNIYDNFNAWCVQKAIASTGQVCPTMANINKDTSVCPLEDNTSTTTELRITIAEKVPHHKTNISTDTKTTSTTGSN